MILQDIFDQENGVAWLDLMQDAVHRSYAKTHLMAVAFSSSNAL